MSTRATIDPREVRVGGEVTTRVLESGKTRWLFKYTAGGKRTKSFLTENEAVTFRGHLRAAKEFGEKFDAETGLPVRTLAASATPDPLTTRTILEVGADVIDKKWQGWSPGNRRTRVESMALVLAEFITAKPPAKMKRRHLVRALRDHLLAPPGQRMPMDAEVAAAAAWLPEHMLPMSELTLRATEQALAGAAKKVSGGGLYARDMLGHQRTSLSLICTEAMRDGLLEVNLAQASESVSNNRGRTVAVDDPDDEDEATRVVDPRRVASPGQCRAIVQAVLTYSSTSWQYAAYWTLLWMTGMRPSEATGLRNRASDLHLPEDGWGWANVRRPIVATGRRWTGTGTAHAARTTTKTNKPRRVKLHPEVVAALRDHVARAEVVPGALLFTNSQGTPLDPSAMGKVWRALRQQHFGGPTDPLGALRVYDLRHTAASLLIKAVGVTAAAEQLGHSPVTLMRVYAKCMETDDVTYEANVEATFG